MSKSPAHQNPFLLIVCIVAAVSLLAPVIASAQMRSGYWVDDGGSITHVDRADASQIVAEEWHVRLYERGVPTGGRNSWGLIIGKSPESVMRQLKEAQDAELVWDRFLGKSNDSERYTYFNSLGHIALIKRGKRKASTDHETQRLSEVFSKIKTYREAAKQIDKTITEEPARTNPFAEVGKVFKEYATNLRYAAERAHKLQELLNDSTMTLASQIAPELDEITRELNTSERELGQMQASIAQTKSQPASPQTFASALQNAADIINALPRRIEDPDRQATWDTFTARIVGSQLLVTLNMTDANNTPTRTFYETLSLSEFRPEVTYSTKESDFGVTFISTRPVPVRSEIHLLNGSVSRGEDSRTSFRIGAGNERNAAKLAGALRYAIRLSKNSN